MPKLFEETLEICIAKIKNDSATIEECIIDFPRYENELRELLPIVYLLKPLQQIKPSQEFSTHGGNRLASKLPTVPVTFWENIRLIFCKQTFKTNRRFRMPQIIVSILVAITMLVGGSFAVEAAAPGDLLYDLDRSFEQIRLRITTNPQDGVSIRMRNATERLEEAENKLRNGEIKNAITALEAYDDAISELDEFIRNENGLNREELRSMMQEENALQQGTLDRIRFSQPSDAQARNAYQKALQRANMGVDTLLGPPEDAPQGPASEDGQGPNENAPQGPSQEEPLGPHENAPQGPNEEDPHGPNKEALRGPTNTP